jgi:uncharacterized phage-associated protein
MATAHDVAKYILVKRQPMSAMKLQKLVYYSQAWSLVWDDKPIFQEQIQAWANGPVVPDLYAKHRGRFEVKDWSDGNVGNLTESERETIDIVLDSYGDKNAQYLSDLTHQEGPWKDARVGVRDGENCGNEITHESMMEYYQSLYRTAAD